MTNNSDDVLSEEQRNELGNAVSSLLPDNKRFVLLIAGIDGPTRLQVISDIPFPEVVHALCVWGGEVITGDETQVSADALEAAGAKVVGRVQ